MFAGQTGKLKGTVFDKVTKEAVIGANVVIEGTYLGAVVQMDGSYLVSNIPPGEYRVAISSVGYQKAVVQKVLIKIDLTTNLDVELQPQTVNIGKEILITAERPLVQKDLTSTSSIVTAGDIKLMPVEEVGQIVNLQAGVVAGHFRGGRTGEVSYLVDGVPVTDAFNGEMSLHVDNSSIRQMEVISGTFNAEYGQAMSGVVNTVIQDGGTKWEGSVNTYAGNFITSNSDLFQNLNKPLRLATNNFQVNLSGPTGLQGLTFFSTFRHSESDGYLYGKRVYNVTDSVPYLPDQSNQSVWVARNTGDNKYVPMNPERHNSFNGKLTYGLPEVKISYSFFYDNNFSKIYDHSFFQTPDGILNHYSTNYFHSLQLSHFPNANTLQTLKLSYITNDYKGYLYENMYDARYVDPTQGWPLTGYTFRSGGNDGSRYSRTTNSMLAAYSLSSQISQKHKIGFGIEARVHKIYNQELGMVNVGDSVNSAGKTIFKIGYPSKGVITDNGRNVDYTKYPVEGSAYIQDKMEYDIMIINIGLRMDYFDPKASLPADKQNPNNDTLYNGYNQFTKAKAKLQLSPRFGVSFPITDQGIIRFSYGHFFQIPNFGNLYTNTGIPLPKVNSLTRVVGNPDLGVQKTVMYEIGLQQVFFGSIILNGSFYYRDIRNLLGMEIVNAYGNVMKYARFINRDYGNVRGFIISIDKRFGDFFSAKLDYTYQIAEGNASDPYAVFYKNQSTPPQEESKHVIPLDWDQRNTLNFSVNIGEMNNWNIGLIMQYGSGSPYTEDARVSKGVTFENNAVKPSTYNVDLRADKRFEIFGVDVSTFLLVYNILDIKNEYGVYWTTGRATSDTNTQYAAAVIGLNTIDQYVNNPSMFSKPREVRVGFGFGL